MNRITPLISFLLILLPACIEVFETIELSKVEYGITATISTNDSTQRLTITNGKQINSNDIVEIDSALLIDYDGSVLRYEIPNEWEYQYRDYTIRVKLNHLPEAGQTYTIKVFLNGCCHEATQTIPQPVTFSHITESLSAPTKDGDDEYVPTLYFTKENNCDTNYVMFSPYLSGNFLNATTTYFSDEDVTPGTYGITAFRSFSNEPLSSIGSNYGRGHRYYDKELHKYVYVDDCYVIEVATMTKENYKFMKAVNKVYNSDGGMFLSLPANLPTNFSGPNVHGQFMALNIQTIIAKAQ
ncbi:MAG: hypothetical protein II951_09300 [Bacteroidales bacterium]|nr:hypothetical protein [Bacteroidales bacterium]